MKLPKAAQLHWSFVDSLAELTHGQPGQLPAEPNQARLSAPSNSITVLNDPGAGLRLIDVQGISQVLESADGKAQSVSVCESSLALHPVAHR